jgi:hypothetical protein
MKKTCAFLLIFLLSIVTVQSHAVLAEQEGDFEYSVDGSAVVIKKYTGAGGDVVIPDMLGGYPVTGIDVFAFYKCGDVTGVTIPDSVTSIGGGAFAECFGLVSVTIPNSVRAINKWTFFSCVGLTSVFLPDSVTVIGEEAFNFCAKLTNVDIPGSVKNIGDRAFANCYELDSAHFYGDAPEMGEEVFGTDKLGFTVYYLEGKTGFSNPWQEYPTEVFSKEEKQTASPASMEAASPPVSEATSSTPGPMTIVYIVVPSVLVVALLMALLLYFRKRKYGKGSAAQKEMNAAQLHYCASCGAQMPADGKFCPKCGKPA